MDKSAPAVACGYDQQGERTAAPTHSVAQRHRVIAGFMLVAAAVLPIAAAAQQAGLDGTPVAADPAAPADKQPIPGGGSTNSTGVLPPSGPETSSTTSQTYQNVYVDGEVHSWKPLEGNTQAAWEAYRTGDYAQAVPVFARLAKLGHPVAEWLMANIYFAGQGVPQDYRQSLIWFEKAANQGYMPAYAPTAQLYEQGKGTPIDLGKAYQWYNIAIAALPYSVERYGLMKQRDAVAALMTSAQVEAAQKRSLGFQPRKVVPPDLEQARQILGQ